MAKRYRVTWREQSGVEYTQDFMADVAFIQQIPDQFKSQVLKSSSAKIVRVEEMG